MAVEIDFYFDIVCPYAYIASTQIDNIVKETNVNVSWQPVLLGGLYELSEAPQGKSNSATTVMAPKKRIYFGRETVMQVERYNVTLNAPKKYPISTLHCMRFLTYIKYNIKNEDLLIKLSHGLYRSFWIDNDRLDDTSVLCNVILALLSNYENGKQLCKINNKSDILNIIENDENIKQLLYNNTKIACKTYGMFGVPTFIVNKNVNNMFWGVDRIPFLKHFCLAMKKSSNNKVLYAPSDLMASIKEKIKNDKNDFYQNVRSQNKIEFYFDFASPWAFLGYMRLKEFSAFAANIELKPVLLGAIFRSVGTANTPMAAVGPVKRKYMMADFARWFEAVGVRVKMNSAFPIRTILPLRVFIIDNSTIDCIFKAAWQQDENIGDATVLCNVLDRNGFNGKELIEATKDEKIKNVLKESTSFAIDKGMFGVPAYVVNKDYQRFVWGQEKMDFVKEMCHGWKAPIKSSIFEKKKEQSSKL